MDHGASALGMDATLLRRKNLYQMGDRTITNTEIKDDVAAAIADGSVCVIDALDAGSYGGDKPGKRDLRLESLADAGIRRLNFNHVA